MRLITARGRPGGTPARDEQQAMALVKAGELYDLFTHLVGFDKLNRYLSTLQSGLDRYPMAGEHPLLGRRVPDVSIRCGGSTSRIYNLLHPAKAVLLDHSDSDQLRAATAQWQGRVNVIQGSCSQDPWALPGAGMVSVPTALLIRSDGYVSWFNDTDQDLRLLRESPDHMVRTRHSCLK